MTTPWFPRLRTALTSRPTAPSRRPGFRRSRLSCEALEGRQMLSGVFTVSNTNDSGPGSLRQAILDSNASPPVSQVFSNGSATAPFNIVQVSLPVGSTISPLSQLPTITQPLDLFAPVNINPSGNLAPGIVLDGSNAGVGAVGLDIQTHGTDINYLAIDHFSGGGVLFDGASATGNILESDYIGVNLAGTAASGNGTFGVEFRGGATNNSVVLSVISANSGNGVVLTGSGTSGNVIQNNLIGTDYSGTHALGNGGSGVVINLGATGNTIGGTTLYTRDVISGNGYYGVYLSDSGTSNNLVEGNYIGTNAAGTAALGNGVNGVEIMNGASSNTIGGVTSSARNVISGNGGTGVVLTNYGTSYNLVEGNYIGTNAAGTGAVGNGVYGVIISGGAASNTIGGLQAGAGDVISGNGYCGVYVTDFGTSYNWLEGDLIGTNAADNAALGNQIGILIAQGASSNGVYNDVISGNLIGIMITDSGTAGNFVYFNEIGTDATGTIAIGNAYYGVYVASCSGNYVIYNTVANSGYCGIVTISAASSNTFYGNNSFNNPYGNMVGY
jgi:parallel beta-helix repeat protein